MSKTLSSSAFLELYESLDETRQASLADYAQYLLDKHGSITKELPQQVDIPRPDEETVVGAIKRLKQTYPMIESMQVFSSASSLMTDHMIKGRVANEVINEMEKIFEDFYNEMLKEFE